MCVCVHVCVRVCLHACVTISSTISQGQWGMVRSEEQVELERQRTFVDDRVSSFRAEISVYRETFKVLLQWLSGYVIC